MTSLDLVLDVEIPHLHAQINGHHQPLNPHRIGGLDPLHKYVSNRIISPRGEMKDLRNHHTVMFEIVRTCRRNSSTHHDPRRKNLAQSETCSVPVAYIMHRLYQDDKTSIGHCVAEGFQANIRAACLCSRAASQAFRTFNCFPSFIPSTSCFRSA